MFTGIIKEVGRVERLEKRSGLWRVGVKSDEIYKNASLSDSISVNGVCLTLIDKKKKHPLF